MKGHRKGAKGELEVISFLQPWWRRLEPEAVFVRTPRSGGWGSTKTKGFKARGDTMVDPETCKLFPFSVECKRRERWSEELFLLDGERVSPVWEWWAQCQRAAVGDGLRPMLWFRKNFNSPSRLKVLGLPNCWLVMIDEAVYDRLSLRGKTPPLVRFDAPRHTVVLTHAQLLWLPPRALVQVCQEAA